MSDNLTPRQREIVSAMHDMAAQGQRMTVRTICERTGGSYGTITPLLAAYRAGAYPAQSGPPPQAVLDAAMALYESARTAAAADIAAALRRETAEAQALLAEQAAEVDTLRRELAQAHAQAQQQAQATAAATAAAAAAMAAIEKMGYGAPRSDRPVLHVPKKSQ